MHGHNSAFRADPLLYVERIAVNNLTWFRRAIANGRVLGGLNNAINAAKEGNFDLSTVKIGTVEFAPVGGGGMNGDPPIRAYWCPFIQGSGMPGWVEIPKLNPTYSFLFTAGMNGCRLVVTDRSHTHFRVYHHQHPDQGDNTSQAVWQQIANAGHTVVATLGYDEYGLADDDDSSPNAFNCMYYRNSAWNFVSQPQTFNMANQAVQRIANRAFMRAIM